jgi:hypothetical protein
MEKFNTTDQLIYNPSFIIDDQSRKDSVYDIRFKGRISKITRSWKVFTLNIRFTKKGSFNVKSQHSLTK